MVHVAKVPRPAVERTSARILLLPRSTLVQLDILSLVIVGARQQDM